MKKALKWLKTVYLAPFLFLMAAEGDVLTEAEKTAELDRLSEESKKNEAIARGDILPEEKKEEEIDPDVVAVVAGETPDDDDKDKEKNGILKDLIEERKQRQALEKRLEALEGKKEPTSEEKAEIERLEAEKEADNPTTIKGMEAKRDALQEKADELLVENGPHDEDRKAIVKEINGLNKDIAKAEMREENHIVQTAASIKQELASVTSDALALYPFLDVNKEVCDEDAVVAVREMRFRLEKEGHTPAEALRQAVEEKGPKFAKLLGITVDTTKQAELKAAREKAALKKAADASLRQPAALPAKGEKEHMEVKIDNLTDKQYDNLPEAEKAKLRGDVL